MYKMKNIQLVTIAVIFLLSSCTKWQSNQKQITKISTNGTWLISSYVDDGSDETNDYTSFRFEFLEDGTLNATDLLNSSSNPYVGSWSITDSNSSDDDDSLQDLDFNILFSGNSLLEELSDDWDIVSYNESEIKLIDISGGNGGTDYLTLTKQ